MGLCYLLLSFHQQVHLQYQSSHSCSHFFPTGTITDFLKKDTITLHKCAQYCLWYRPFWTNLKNGLRYLSGKLWRRDCSSPKVSGLLPWACLHSSSTLQYASESHSSYRRPTVLHMYITHLVYPCIPSGHGGCFRPLAIVSTAAMRDAVCTHYLFKSLLSAALGIVGSEMAGSYSSSMLKSLGNCHSLM